MLGKKSDVSLAFHSIYFMPTYKLNESSDILFRLGYSSLNTNDNALPDSAHMIGLGYEINVSDKEKNKKIFPMVCFVVFLIFIGTMMNLWWF